MVFGVPAPRSTSFDFGAGLPIFGPEGLLPLLPDFPIFGCDRAFDVVNIKRKRADIRTHLLNHRSGGASREKQKGQKLQKRQSFCLFCSSCLFCFSWTSILNQLWRKCVPASRQKKRIRNQWKA